jgi:hypothetical protein
VAHTTNGLVVVENNADATSVIAVNYASSVDANLLVVDRLAEHEVDVIQMSIREWKENGNDAQLQRVKDGTCQRL